MDDAHPVTQGSDAPIYKLNDDILLHIFKINGNMEDDDQLIDEEKARRNNFRAIKTTLNSSQVCARWRNLIVNSPLLWADLIDIHTFHFSGPQWRKEVLQRTKGCTLHVKGVMDLKHITDLWWMNFLEDHWQRIRIFSVVLVSEDFSKFIQDRLDTPQTMTFFDRRISSSIQIALRFLSWPTTTLEYFNLEFPFRFEPVSAPFSIFGGSAPRLRSLQIFNAPVHIPLFKQRNSFSQIECLDVHGQDICAFSSVQTFLQILSQLPRLQSLFLSDAINLNHQYIPGDPIHLPFLTKMTIASSNNPGQASFGGTKTPYWQILNAIVPKPGCSIQVDLLLDRPIDIDVVSFSRYVENYFTSHAPQALVLVSTQKSFTLSSQRSTKASVIPSMEETSNLQINIYYCRFVPPTDERMHEIFNAAFCLSFPTVTTLELIVPPNHRALSTDPQFRRLLSTFSSVRHLFTNVGTLYSLCTSKVVNPSDLFPRLSVLEVPLEDDDAVHTLFFFLDCRSRGCFPMPSFNYRPLKYRTKLMDLTSLDIFEGMKVRYETDSGRKRKQYVCGSGQRERLDFKNKGMI